MSSRKFAEKENDSQIDRRETAATAAEEEQQNKAEEEEEEKSWRAEEEKLTGQKGGRGRKGRSTARNDPEGMRKSKRWTQNQGRRKEVGSEKADEQEKKPGSKQG